MKKTIIILLLVLLALPLFARGVTETVSKDGIQGLFDVIREVQGIPVENPVVFVEPEVEEAVVEETDEVVEPVVESAEAAVLTVPVAEAAEAEVDLTVPFYETDFSYYGLKSHVTISDIQATFTIQEEVKPQELSDVFVLLVSAYPAFKEATFYTEGSLLIIDYPQVDRDILLSVYPLVESVVKDYIDYLAYKLKNAEVVEEPEVAVQAEEPEVVAEPVAEPVPEETVTVVEPAVEYAVEAPVEETVTVVEPAVEYAVETPAYDSPASEEVSYEAPVYEEPEEPIVEAELETIEPEPEEVALSPAEPVETEVTVKTNKAKAFSFDLDLGFRNLIVAEENEASFLPTFGVSASYTWKLLYGQLGAECMVYSYDEYVFNVAVIKANAGITLKGSVFEAFGYYGVRYILATQRSGFESGFFTGFGCGIAVNLSEHLGVKLQYEDLAKERYINISMCIKF